MIFHSPILLKMKQFPQSQKEKKHQHPLNHSELYTSHVF